jgi:hypothetical protein
MTLSSLRGHSKFLKMTEFLKYLFSILLLTISSCKNFDHENSSLKMIDIEGNVENMQVIELSRFTDDIQYVPLETIENLLVSYITDLDISQDLILVSDMKVCLLYKIDGHFILKVGDIGRGPGEYPYITNVNLGKFGEIYLSDTEDLYEYRCDGLFIKKYTNILLNESYYLPNWILIGDSLLFGHVPNETGQEKNKALMIDKFGHVKHYYKNYILFKRDKKITFTMENHAQISMFNSNVFYKELFNDTLFYLSANKELLPKYAFLLGNYKASEAARKTVDVEQFFKCIFLYNVFQTVNYLFIDFDFGFNFPAKRLTQKKPPAALSGAQFLDRYGWYNTRNALGVYDKRSGSVIFSKPTSTDNPLFTSGLYNDIDAGPRFFPRKQVNDSTMVMWINAEELKTHVASDDFKNNVPKYPEKKRKLEELANSLTELDNPVLMFVTFKY